ncbi:MAG: alpha/beta hydrolase [Pseudomonadota bacterium]
MTAPDMLSTSTGRQIAYHRTVGAGPGIVFLGGFKSDMGGTKALHLEAWAKANGRQFLRFDYSGHGESSEGFEDGSIGDWFEDAAAAIIALTEGPQILVGSSMGGWISLLFARANPDRVAALVGIAAAPDFTEDSMWAGFSEAERETLLTEGKLSLPSEYGEPYVITRRLIEEGRNTLVLREPLPLPFPVRLLYGDADVDVEMRVQLGLMAHANCEDLRLTIVKGADHRFSTPECLDLIERTVGDMSRPLGR